MLAYPTWLLRLPAARRPAARRRFLLRIAAVYASEAGHMTDLSALLGMSVKSLGAYSTATSSKRITPAMAKGIEKATRGLVMAQDVLNDPA